MKAIKWIVGVMLVFLSFGALEVSIFSFLCLLISGLFVLQPTFEYIQKLAKWSISREIRIVTVILLPIVVVAYNGYIEDQKKKAIVQAEKVRYDNLPQPVKDSMALAAKKQEEADSVIAVFAAHQKKIDDLFSAWNGAHINLERGIKKSMNDPKGYEHVSTTYKYKSDKNITVQTTFRAKNVYGGLVLNTVTAQSDIDGNIVKIISQE